VELLTGFGSTFFKGGFKGGIIDRVWLHLF